jgi:hypothetical protein
MSRIYLAFHNTFIGPVDVELDAVDPDICLLPVREFIVSGGFRRTDNLVFRRTDRTGEGGFVIFALDLDSLVDFGNVPDDEPVLLLDDNGVARHIAPMGMVRKAQERRERGVVGNA